jgi:hypothetical protein
MTIPIDTGLSIHGALIYWDSIGEDGSHTNTLFNLIDHVTARSRLWHDQLYKTWADRHG